MHGRYSPGPDARLERTRAWRNGRRAGFRSRCPSGCGAGLPPLARGPASAPSSPCFPCFPCSLVSLAPQPPLRRGLVGQDVPRGGVHDVLGHVEQRGDVLADRLGLGRRLVLAEAAVVPAGVHAPGGVAGAVVGAAPRRLGRQVELAAAHDLAVRVRAALAVATVDPHGHAAIVADGPSDTTPPRPRSGPLPGAPIMSRMGWRAGTDGQARPPTG